MDPIIQGASASVANGLNFSDCRFPKVIGGKIRDVLNGINFAGATYTGNELHAHDVTMDNVGDPIVAAANLTDYLVTSGCTGLADWGKAVTISDNSATPSVKESNFAILANGSATNITNFVASTSNRFRGARWLMCRFDNNNTTLVHGTGVPGIRLSGAANFNPTASDTMLFWYYGGQWIEVARTQT